VVKGKKILVTGPAGQIAQAICRSLAPDNDVWGIARFSRPDSCEFVESLGVTARAVDLADPDFSSLPDDFDFVLHLAAYMGREDDHDHALRINAEAPVCCWATSAMCERRWSCPRRASTGRTRTRCTCTRRRTLSGTRSTRTSRRTPSRRSPRKPWHGITPGSSTCPSSSPG